jgi:hypothetical protein
MSHEPDGSADRMDLSPLDPLGDDESLERFVGRVRAAATRELLRRQAPPRLGDLIVRMRRPILAASGLLALASLLVLLTVQPSRRQPDDAVATALGVPGVCADWAYSTGRPSVGELLGSGRSQ